MGYNEYCEFDIEIVCLTQLEIDWFNSNLIDIDLDNIDFDANLNDIDDKKKEYHSIAFKFCDKRDDTFPNFSYEIDKEKNTILLHSGECGEWSRYGHKQLAKVLQAFLVEFRREDTLKFRWVCWDNRGQNTYNGGAYKITATNIESINLKEWLDNT